MCYVSLGSGAAFFPSLCVTVRNTSTQFTGKISHFDMSANKRKKSSDLVILNKFKKIFFR